MLLYRLSATALIAGLSWGSVACTSGHEAKRKEVSAVWEAAVHPRFELTSLDTAPFPSNAFTVSDPSHLTGRRVNLPHPDCSVRRSDCEDIAHLNELDGFNLLPRLSIPFDGDIDPASVSSSTVLLLAIGDATATHTRGGDPAPPPPRVVGINEVVWDPATTTLHVESDQLLDQHTSYALLVTRGVRSSTGKNVEASEPFLRLKETIEGGYRRELLEALSTARRAGIAEHDIVVASVFTTQSATLVLEKIRDQLRSLGAPSVTFDLGPRGARTNFALSEIAGITVSQQTRGSPPGFTPVAVDLPSLRLFTGAVGGIAYGKYSSPDYLVHPGGYMPAVGTGTGTPVPRRTNDIYFNVIYPAGTPPARGWPVVIYGHGAEGNKDEWMARVAGSLAVRGIATVSINTFATGFGPLSTVTVQRASGDVTFLSGGRSTDQNGDKVIGSPEGIEPRAPHAAVFLRDSFRQQVVDWMQLVRVIQLGVDYDGDGTRDLDASRIYYIGQSHGGALGTIFSAVEPAVRASVINVAGGSIMEHTRLSGVGGRRREGVFLANRSPSLLNSPGVSMLDGVEVPAPFWFENKPLLDGAALTVKLTDGRVVTIHGPVTNRVAGAMDIQRVQEWKEWCSLAGDPIAYAPHLRKLPLAGVPAKRILIQFYKADRNFENPQSSDLIRAGELQDRSTYYRHDLAFAADPLLAKNPHQFFQNLHVTANRPITLALQEQAAAFIASDGEQIDQPVPAHYFEVPIQGPLPETLNHIP
jgi:hypothetical protein